ncbi:GNAT family N-acetyltransferase [Agarivorans sp. QJM3NY_25]
MQDVTVQPEYRRQGLGSEIMSLIEKYLNLACESGQQ